ncbi:MAG: hypothetical protein KME31_27590 [Tolypothrix carrinoi HA7290-LM1]|nr:hypothetical protein [Tolypothrix carrinoi HA7290-LM1]
MGNGQWAMGNGQWAMGIKRSDRVFHLPTWTLAPCPMPHAPCPMPNAPCPITHCPFIINMPKC